MIKSLLASFLLPTTILCSPVSEARAFTLPKTTLSNGAVNPFYPCGVDPSTCPYRCYVLPSPYTNSTSDGLSKLQPKCYSQAEAAAFQNVAKSEEHACVQCVTPNSVEIPKNKDSPLNCQPLSTYFQSTASNDDTEFPNYPLMAPYPKAALPSRAGSRAMPIPDCAWECAEAQVPFSVCSSTNATGQYETCKRVVPQCSSPVTVGGNAAAARGPHLSDVGTCSMGVQTVECPWSCRQDGRDSSDNSKQYNYCSLVDKSNASGTLTCTKCPVKS